MEAWKRAAVALAVIAGAYVAVEGGEYSTTDLLRQRARANRLQGAVDSLEQDVDSLRSLKKRLADDPALQERVAREVHGMVRSDKELVYRFTEAKR